MVELPFAFYQGFVLEHRYGLSTQSVAHWLADQVKGMVLGIGLGIVGASIVFATIRRWPDTWWIVSASGLRAGHGGVGSRRPCSAAAAVLQVQAARSSGAFGSSARPGVQGAHRCGRGVRMGGQQPHEEGQRGVGRNGADTADPAVRHPARRLLRGRDRSDSGA